MQPPPRQGPRGGAHVGCYITMLVCCLLSAVCFQAFAQGTALTYQGRLNSNGVPFTGNAEFQPTLWDSVSSGAQVAVNTPASLTVGVTNGLFVLPLDFGANFPGADRWLQLDVRTSIGPFTPLTQRQRLTPTPYAITASNLTGLLPAAQLSGALPSTNLAGTYSGAVAFGNAANSFVGNGSGLTSLSANNLASGAVPSAALSNAWKISGNSGASPANGYFIGTTDNQPLELRVNGQRALRLEPDGRPGAPAPSLMGGFSSNVIEQPGSGANFIGGGGYDLGPNIIHSNSSGVFIGAGFGNEIGPSVNGSAIVSGYGNSIKGLDSFVGGGIGNAISAFGSVIAGGVRNTNLESYAAIGGGESNLIQIAADHSVIGGGSQNTVQSHASYATIAGGYSQTIGASAQNATIGGGQFNMVGGTYGTVPGGWANQANGQYALAAGFVARAQHDGTFVWSGFSPDYSAFMSTGTNQFLLRVTGGVGINTNNPNGAALNVAGTARATAFQGDGSGLVNLRGTSLTGVIPTTALSNAWGTAGNAGTSAGAQFLGTTDNQPLEFKVNGTRALRIEPNTNNAPNMIGGSPANFVAPGIPGAVIAGGGLTDPVNPADTNSVYARFSAIGGGSGNTIQANDSNSTIGGGWDNTIQNDSPYSTIGGGVYNTIQTNADISTIAGGYFNTVQSDASYSTIGGGAINTIQTNANSSTIAGGQNNTIQMGTYQATIGGGGGNTIQTNCAFATIAGGDGHTIQSGSPGAMIGGGYENNIGPNGYYSTIGGGLQNAASGPHATVPGGYANTAAGDLSFAAGYRAKALHDGSFVWADSTSSGFASTANNQFSVLASGGLVFAGDVSLSGDSHYHNLSMSGGNSVGYLYGSFPALGDGIHVGYNWYADDSGNGHVSNSLGATSRITASYGFVSISIGGVNAAPNTQRLLANSTGVTVNGTFNNASDRNAKQDFTPISPSRILDGVLRLPVSEWSYKDDPVTRHVGPVAQDFYSVFNIGSDDKHIAPLDEGGLAFAAIQGLNQKVEARTQDLEERSRRLEIENAELRQKHESLERRLEALEQSVFEDKSK